MLKLILILFVCLLAMSSAGCQGEEFKAGESSAASKLVKHEIVNGAGSVCCFYLKTDTKKEQRLGCTKTGEIELPQQPDEVIWECNPPIKKPQK